MLLYAEIQSQDGVTRQPDEALETPTTLRRQELRTCARVSVV